MTVFPGAYLWKLHATHGLSIEDSLPVLARSGLVVSWTEFLVAAHRDGASWKVLIPRLCFAVREYYPPEIASVIAARLGGVLQQLEN